MVDEGYNNIVRHKRMEIRNKKKSKIKIVTAIIVLIVIPVAAYFDYTFLGYKSIIGYILTCLFEFFIFFSGVSFGEWLQYEYGEGNY